MSDRSFNADGRWLINRETSRACSPYFQASCKQSWSPTKPVFFSPYFPARPREAAADQQPSCTDTPPAGEDPVI